MRPEKLNYILSSISSLKGVGPKLEQIINKLGIYKNIHFVWNIPNNILERKFYENIHDAEINLFSFVGSICLNIGCLALKYTKSTFVSPHLHLIL